MKIWRNERASQEDIRVRSLLERRNWRWGRNIHGPARSNCDGDSERETGRWQETKSDRLLGSWKLKWDGNRWSAVSRSRTWPDLGYDSSTLGASCEWCGRGRVEAGRPPKKWQQWPRWKTQVTWSYALAMKSEGQLLDSKYILKGEWTGWWVEYETGRGGGKEDPKDFEGSNCKACVREWNIYIHLPPVFLHRAPETLIIF